MWIKRARFVNFAWHDELELEFPCGLVGIVGPNGSGKSTVVNGLFSAITGDFGRFPGVKADNVRQGSIGESSVTVWFEHKDVEYVVFRNLRPRKEPRSYLRNLTTGETFDKVDEEISRVLGVSNQVLASHVFIPQHAMSEFLTQTPAVRAETFQRLFGLDKAQKAYDVVDALVSGKTRLSLPTGEGLRDARAKLELEGVQIRGAITSLGETLEALTPTLLTDEEIGLFNGLVAQAAAYGGLKEAVSKAEARLAAAGMAANAAARELSRAESSLKAARLTEEEKAGLAGAKERAASLLGYEKAVARKQAADNAASGVRAEHAAAALAVSGLPTEAYASALHNAAVERRGEAVSEIRRLKEHLKRLTSLAGTDDGVCPTCGQVLDGESLLKHREETSASIANWSEAAIRFEADVNRAQEVVRQVRDAWCRLTDAGNAVKLNEATANGFVGRPDLDPFVGRAAAMSRDVERISLKARAEAEAVAAETAARAEVARTKQAVAAASDDLARRREAAEEARCSPEDVKQAVELLKQDRETRDKVAAAKADLRTRRGLEAANAKAVAECEAALAVAARANEIRSDLADAMEVLRKQGLPAFVSSINLARMCDAMNSALSESFGGPFAVETDDSLGFNVEFDGLPPFSAQRLSAGQKVVLALVFRVVNSDLSGAGIDLLVMDEPCDSLDEANIQRLAEALTAFSGKVRGRRQIIMVTHQPALREVFDKVLSLEPGA